MATRIRTLNFLPDIFKTPANTQFLRATLDQIVDQPNLKKVEGYIGSKFGYGINASSHYVTEPTKTRVNYQLDPGVVFLKQNTNTAQDFISYPGILDALKLQGAETSNNTRLFASQYYSWDSFVDLDKVINFNQYYWIPTGLPQVTVGVDSVFDILAYVVVDNTNGYTVASERSNVSATNPTITLMRGGTYTFAVNQNSQFWIQGEAGTTGFSKAQSNLQTRDVLGVQNNGENSGLVTFSVPSKDAQDQYDFPGNNLVDLVTSLRFDQINSIPVSAIGNIDGLTALDGRTVMFFNTGVQNEQGYISNFNDAVPYDETANVVPTLTISVTGTTATNTVICDSTEFLSPGQTITFTGTSFSGLETYSTILPYSIYYVDTILGPTTFTLSQPRADADPALVLSTASGSMTGYINQGLFEAGYFVDVGATFFRITYVGDYGAEVVKLTPTGPIPSDEKITATYGTQWINRTFYRDSTGQINLIPYLSATLDTMYYQDGTSSNKVGRFKLIDNNYANTLNILEDILGQLQYTAPNGVVFTNGLTVSFSGDIYPASYENIPFFVEGVGTAIELLPVAGMIAAEITDSGEYIPFDSVAYDIGNFDSSLYVPVEQDYITIARNAVDKNAWARSNRWFHVDVISATATYNHDPSIVTTFTAQSAKAKRPVIEFYPGLKLFNSGVVGKKPIDFIDFRTTDAFSQVEGKLRYFPDVSVSTGYTASLVGVTEPTLTTTITVPANSVTGNFVVGQYVVDSDGLLPINTRISAITGTTTLTLTLAWTKDNYGVIPNASNLSLIATVGNSDNFSLFDGARVVFAADTNSTVRNKIYTARISSVDSLSAPVITLSQAPDGEVQADELTFVYRGTFYHSKDFYYDGTDWLPAQQKSRVNQPPLFDVMDNHGISFGNQSYYGSSSFTGSTLFAYGPGAGMIDPVLGFPIRYSSVDNVGDISFDVTLNSDTFNYVTGQTPITEQINTGYVFKYSSLTDYTRNLGWQTAIGPSVQNQIFEFKYLASTGKNTFVCDVAMLDQTQSKWPTIQVYINNVVLADSQYTISVSDTSTAVTVTMPTPSLDNVVQVTLLSNQVSATAYYEIPINLNNNPLNANVKQVNVGDIRRHYQSIFNNAPNTVGNALGPNNYRDSGDLVPYGSSIIQNSASLVLPGTFLRKQNHSLFDALLFNNREYINFKTLLINTINNTAYETYPNAHDMLDAAMDQITLTKTDDAPFFWSDMLPTKAAYITNKYAFANSLDTSIYPLSRIYDFTKANYFGVVVYLTRIILDVITITQLVRGVDYTVSADSPSLTIVKQMVPGDRIDIREYNQTYGSFVPNTPTKLGLYPATMPEIKLDTGYMVPTYFVVGHDGSYTRLYGEYDPVSNSLTDFRDQVLLEFEMRVYSNLKVSAAIPINEYEIMPGFFRDTGYSIDEIRRIYSSGFLNWIGQNRIEYQTQQFRQNDQFTFNYYQSQNKLSKTPIEQGNWRGLYGYLYDTSNPETAPWEMLGFKNKPTWFDSQYGEAPYTSDNLVLWGDLEAGINWNNGSPVVIPHMVRPGLSKILPVDTAGDIVSPFIAVVGNYINQTFNHSWKVCDCGPAEFSYRRSSSWPFDLMRIMALTKPAEFYNLAVDLDNYKHNAEFNQYLVNNRSHLVIKDIEIYGTGVAKTSYLNWVVDYEKQIGVPATQNITDLLDNLDVRLLYRVAGFSDKDLLKFYVEKSTTNGNNSSLLIPDESYAVLLYDNQPFTKIVYSGVVIQITAGGYKVFGSSQTLAYFTTRKPLINGQYTTVRIENLTVQIAKTYSDEIVIVPYGTEYTNVQELSQFLDSYGKYLEMQGVVFEQIINGIPVNWSQMVAEFLYWAQSGWEVGSIVNINPAAEILTINKDSNVVQPLTLHQQNFILNQNMYPIGSTDLAVVRDGTLFSAEALKDGDSINYGEFNVSNFEHGIVFDNVTVFGDRIYHLVTGLRQDRITARGTKTADWNGTVDAQGFILNQDNVQEWNNISKYTTGAIVTYKNKYWIAKKIVQASETFNETNWKQTDYNEVQKGLLPNPSTRSYESTIYYNSDRSSLDADADLMSFSLIGYRPRDYLAVADLTTITQINVYKNLIKSKGTPNAANAFKGATLSQGGIDYNIYENWAIKTAEFGGVLNSNFVEFKLSEDALTSNPCVVGLTNGTYTAGVHQEVPIYSLFNYGRPIRDPKVLTVIPGADYVGSMPGAGFVNYNDVKLSSYYYSGLSSLSTPLSNLYVRDNIWLADYQGTWQVVTPGVIGQVVRVTSNLNDTATFTFDCNHNLDRYQAFAVVNFDPNINGYYSVAEVVDRSNVLVNVTLNMPQGARTGQGIGFAFLSARAAKPSEILSVPLITTEFEKNTVWVDTDNTGDWAVYRKSINYLLGTAIPSTASTIPFKAAPVEFGSAVAHTDALGYLVADSGAGEVYRYSLNDLFHRYDLVQTITGAASFGTTISYADDTFVVSQPTGATRTVSIYKLVTNTTVDSLSLLQTISSPGGVTNWGSATALSKDKIWLYISDVDNNSVHAYRLSTITGLYEAIHIIDGDALGLTTTGDNFGYSLSTGYYGKSLIVGAPNKDNGTISDWGYTYVFNRAEQRFEAQYSSIPNVPQEFQMAWTPPTTSRTATDTTATSNVITVSATTTFVAGTPVVFSGTIIPASGLSANRVYYVLPGFDTTHFSVSTARGGTPVTLTTVGSGSMVVTLQATPLGVAVNGTTTADNLYAVIGTKLYVYSDLLAGDIIEVGGHSVTLAQTLSTEATPRVGVKFGQSVATTKYASEILVGAPFALNDQNQEGAVFRFTNGGAKYGTLIGTSICSITATPLTILLNGYAVTLPVGSAASAAEVINNVQITNIQASAPSDPLDPNFGILTISLIDPALAGPNDKLILTVLETRTLASLGINTYTQTQVINDPHDQQTTQFGTKIKFNEFDSFVVSAPTSTRFVSTTFDFTDDANTDNDLLFDNNSTRWVDTFRNAGAVYMFDYLSNYNESLVDPGKFVYAQCVNDTTSDYGAMPMFGHALDFNNSQVIIGTPGFRPGENNGQVVTFVNRSGARDWAVYRSSAPIVDVNRIQDIQLFSAETNMTLDNLDYIDPLSGKLLGSVQENIDVISNQDPAGYTSVADTDNGALVWGSNSVGKIWFNTSTTRFVNYHQNDVVYDSTNWGKVFPGSNVTIYTWITSTLPPARYAGTGTPYDLSSYTTEYTLSSSDALTPSYFFWVRNTNKVFTAAGKTLADTTIESYITSPQNSGISYFAPLQADIFALYNCGENINVKDTVLHIGFASGTTDDVSHSLFNLIRADYADDFVPGLPNATVSDIPSSLYNKLIDSLCGVDISGAVVPNPYLPKAVQYGIQTRPNQSFFISRYEALKNYLTYANAILAQYPITETKQPTMLSASGEHFDTTQYWNFATWWATGYNDTTKSFMQVPLYANLATINASEGLIVTVATNGNGQSETYIYQDSIWNRIGLQNGTIQFKKALWDYASTLTGFGDSFYDIAPYSEFPSEETRYIIRSLTEEIYTDELLIHRNKSLILLFEFIQSETTDAQNYLPWLNKTSFVDVSHTIRELKPIPVYQSDNQEFLSGYLNEIKPYHVVIKEFIFKYTGAEAYTGDVTDFDLPAQYNTSVGQFITPEMVYSNPNENQYLPSDPIWQTGQYREWATNYGLSLTGAKGYEMTWLASYMVLNTSECKVDNAFGFPVSGTIRINDELIGYSSVDRNLGIIHGLTRGLQGTAITTHLPGSQIFIDLPPAVLLNGGRGYTNPPKVTAWIDTAIYPAPTRPAILSAVMQFDTIMRIDVIDPGAGYAVTPEIQVAPADTVSFSSSEVQVSTNTIRIYSATSMQSGDLVEYYTSPNAVQIGGVHTNSYYYVGVLDVTPTLIISLYTTYADAVNDRKRVQFTDVGSGNHYVQMGGIATCITSSLPVRENLTTLRFDRTAYNSEVMTWIPGSFYSAFYAGLFNNSNSIASSAILLESSRPPISAILASAAGEAFALLDVEAVDNVTWTSTSRQVVSTDIHGIITVRPNALGAEDYGAVYPMLGFYVDMPIKFIGAAIGGIVTEQMYYIAEIVSETQFRMSTAIGGSPVSLTAATVPSVGLTCYAGTRTLGAIVTIDYPGISEITRTDHTANKITVPLTGTGQNGTTGYYTGLSVTFTGTVLRAGSFTVGNSYRILTAGTSDFTMFGASSSIPGTEFVATNIGSGTGTVTSMFGGLVENDPYYITAVCDNQTFTVSRKPEPIIIDVTAIQPQLTGIVSSTSISGPDTIQCNVSAGFVVGMPIIFTGTMCGGLVADIVYYLKTVDYNLHRLTICELPDLVTTKVLTPATPAGVLTINVNSVIVCNSTLSLKQNDPIIFNAMVIADAPVTNFGGIVSGQLYYVSEVFLGNTSFAISNITYGGNIPLTIVEPTVPPASHSGCVLISQVDVEPITTGTGSMVATIGLPISPGQINGQQFTLYQSSEEFTDRSGTDGNLITRHIVSALGAVVITDTTSGTNLVTVRAGDPALQINDEITVAGTAIGNLIAGTYYVKAFTSYNTFTVSATRVLGLAGPVFVQSTASGTMSLADVDNPIVPLNRLSLTRDSGGFTNAYVNMPFKLAASYGTLVAGTTYFVLTHGQVVTAVTSTSSSGNVLTCVSTVGFYPGMLLVFTGAILGGLEYGLEYYILEVLSPTQFTVAGAAAPGSPVIVLTTTNGSMTGTGEHYVTICDTTPGNTVIPLDTTTGLVIAVQAPTAIPMFSVSFVMGGYRVMVSPTAMGSGYAIDNVISIPGLQVGGVTPANNLTITVSGISDHGVLTEVICAGAPNEFVEKYYLKVITDTKAELYTDALMTLPANGYDIQTTFPGIKSTTVTDTNVSGVITVSDGTHFFVNDEVVFTGEVFGGLEVGMIYYVTTKSTNDFTVSVNPGGTDVTLTTESGSCVMSKPGTYLLLPEPFYFNQNIVKFNNRVYQCVISNSDADFIFGKWILLSSDSRKLNALDRILGYYSPTDNMPGIDLTQLVDGITYPNSTYLGNAFAPEDSYPIDTMLQDQPFYPAEVNLMAIAWDGTTYLAASNTPNYSAVVNGTDAKIWNIDKISAHPLDVTDIINVGAYYVMTTRNTATPILISSDGFSWATNGEYTPFDVLPFAEVQFDMTAISAKSLSMNSVAYLNDMFVVVGDGILSSPNTYVWTESYTFNKNRLINILTGVTGIDVAGFTGFIAVGRGQHYEYPVGGITTAVDNNLLLTSADGLSWSPQAVPLTTFGLNAVADNGTTIVVVGDNSVRYHSTNGSNWISASVSEPVGVFSTVDTLNLLFINDTSTLSVNGAIEFIGMGFGNVMSGTTYYVRSIPTRTSTTVTDTQVTTNHITCTSTAGLQVNHPITFTGTTFGNIVEGQTYYITAVVSLTKFTVSIRPGDVDLVLTTDTGSCTVQINPVITVSESLVSGVAGPEFALTSSQVASNSIGCTVVPRYNNITDLIYDGTAFVAVGYAGLIETSTDGVTWTPRVSGTTENLNGIIYNDFAVEYVAVGNNNTILRSADLITWVASSVLTTDAPVYDVQGDAFLSGYGPEELVPGVVSDDLSMTVTTRPGTNWSAQEYAHTGYNVVSTEITPT